VPGRKPFGYYRGEAEVIVRMEALRAKGLGFDRIAARLNADDVPSRCRKSWNGIVVNRILARTAQHTDTGTAPGRGWFGERETPAARGGIGGVLS